MKAEAAVQAMVPPWHSYPVFITDKHQISILQCTEHWAAFEDCSETAVSILAVMFYINWNQSSGTYFARVLQKFAPEDTLLMLNVKGQYGTGLEFLKEHLLPRQCLCIEIISGYYYLILPSI